MSKTTKIGTVKKIFGATVSVLTSGRKTYSKYHKTVKSDKKYLADRSGLEIKEGDVILIEEVAPISKKKKWKVKKVIDKK